MNIIRENTDQQEWTEVISPHTSLLQLRLHDIWRYRDLLMLLVRRDFVSVYKQTILGPLWMFIQPLLTSLIYVIIFTQVAHLPSDGLPPVLFYLAGITCWNYFAACLTNTANTFINNAGIFGKVYFPRLIMPLSNVIANLVRFGIQLLLLVFFMIYYAAKGNMTGPTVYVLLLPLLLIVMAGIGLGFGMIISSLTTKYRDLLYLMTFGVQLWMYASPVIYPLTGIPGDKLRFLAKLNPMTGIIEAFRFALLGKGYFSWELLAYDMLFSGIIMLCGMIIFNKAEKSFMDTI